MSAVRLVARREIVERSREKALWVGTLVTLAIVAAVIVLPSLFGGGADKVKVAVASPQAERIARLAARTDRAFDVVVQVRRVRDDAAVRARIAGRKAGAGIVDGGRTIVRRGGTPKGAVAALQAASQRLRQLAALKASGADPGATRRILSPPPLAVTTVDAGAEDRQGFAIVTLIVLYGQLISYGIWVATGIVEEKQSRIVEILLAAIRPRELLAGKVLGIGLVGFAQLLLIGVVALAIAAASGAVDVGANELTAVPIALAWFVLGYALYACAFAVVGAIVPRQEDIQSTATPVMLALLGSFFLSFNAVQDPGGTLAAVLTYLPTSSPLVVPVRLIGGDVAAWQVVVSVALLLGTVATLIAVAGRVYGNAVLQTGGRVRLRAALAGD